MQAIGLEIYKAVKPIRDKYPGMEVIFSFGLPREGNPDLIATAFAHTFDKGPSEMLMRLIRQLLTLTDDIKANLVETVEIDE